MSISLRDIGRRVQSQIYQAGVFGTTPKVPVSPDRLEHDGLRAMSGDARSYVETGAGTGRTIINNRNAFAHWQLVPRVLRDVSERDQSIELFGRRHPSPFLTAPVGVLEMCHPDGDLAVARAARASGVPMIISSQASYPMEAIADELGDHERWFQLYWSADDDLARSFVRRAEAIGASAIVVTLDTMLLGWRTLDLDRAYSPFARARGIANYTSDPVFQDITRKRLQEGQIPSVDRRPTPSAVRSLGTIARAHPGDFRANLRSKLPMASIRTFQELFGRLSLNWEELAWLRDLTDLPILVKGIQSPEDAELALRYGVDGIIVSNHGGRQLDGAIGSLDALPAVAERVGDRVPILFDSGIRCAADAFKALALGATAVCIARPYVYGLALAGEDGVREVLRNFQAEFDLSMAVAGLTSTDQFTPDILVPATH
ncbi:alpha-hydroxy-acid oxidizing protein [Allobranchiibius sp. GilTou73]|uniref:alpha-hydroxy-acid oxidizing protein n=1 Tax=Allobranchiibius sp. GilTou73 TaxID=2904523 RepID=UPI001F17F0A4|nr:alpha-hydroxy-acid oxidizing protein [Allobranchiibius sp. GilTou73]UIJ35930.1 alpha-hydroxy-acid oxidizing protein [Allobranchiibius sp. GilTou73]